MSNKKKGWIFGSIGVVVLIAIVLVVVSIRAQAATNNATSAYQTTTVTRGTLTSTVEGTGTIASLLDSKLTWQTGGQVDKVNVQTGDKVKANDVLASMQASAETQTGLEADLVTAQENLAELTSSAIANAQVTVAKDQTALISAQSAFDTVKNWKNAALIQDQYANVVVAKAALDKAQTAYDAANVGEFINNPGEAALYQALYNAQQKYSQAQYYYSLYSQAPTQNNVSQTQANLDLAKATLANDQNYLTALSGGTVPENATGTSLLKLKQAQLAVQSAQDKLQNYLDSTTITAPFDGTVTQASVVPGASVASGAAAFTVDDLTQLVVAVQITEVDVNNVKIGQPAVITFDAIPNKTYKGKVIRTDLAGTVGQNSVNFDATVQVTDADALVKPGMTANVTIVTNQVEGALLVPSTAIFTDNSGKQFVYLVQNGQLTSLAVTVGASSDTTSEITASDLQEGDQIVLSFASTGSSSTTGGRGFGLLGGLGGGGVRVQSGGAGNTTGGKPVTNP